MLLVGVKDQHPWLISRWNLTYPCSWQEILKGIEASYDYYDDLELLVDNKTIDVSKNKVLELEEAGSFTIRGGSQIIHAPLMITFYNQLNAVDVNVIKNEEFKSADYQSFNKSLCQYMDSIELLMHR